MWKQRNQIMLVLVAVFTVLSLTLTGCCPYIKPDIKNYSYSFIQTFEANSRVALVEYKTTHKGSAGARVAAGLCLGIVGQGIAGASETKTKIIELRELNKPTDKTHKENYITNLDNKCLKEIEKILNKSSLFSYVSPDKLFVSNHRFENEQDFIEQVIADNSL